MRAGRFVSPQRDPSTGRFTRDRSGGEVTAGVIYQPITDETFWAEKTRGAWLHDGRLRVSARSRLSDALVATGIPFQGHGDFGEWTKIFAAIGPQVAGIFMNLAPLFAAVMSAAFLREAPHWYHGAAFVLIVGGIVVSTRR